MENSKIGNTAQQHNLLGNPPYPTVLQAIHLVVLYIFIQALVDFPLALIDYFKDTETLYHPVKKVILGVGSVVFILWYGYRKTGHSIREVIHVTFNLWLFPLLFLFFPVFSSGLRSSTPVWRK